MYLKSNTTALADSNVPILRISNRVCGLLKKISEARRAKNRRAEAYFTGTLERGD